MNAQKDIPSSHGLRVKFTALAEQHLDAVLEIEHEAFTTPWRRQDFTGLIDNPDALSLAALHSGRLVGYSCAWRVLECAELGNIAVARDYRGHGIARGLLESTIRHYRRERVESIFLEVRTSNNRAIWLYELFGFTRIGVRRGYYRNPVEDALIMRLEI